MDGLKKGSDLLFSSAPLKESFMIFDFILPRKRITIFLAAAGLCLGGCAHVAGNKGPRLKEDGPGPQKASEYAGYTWTCTPSCYRAEKQVRPPDPIRGCGFKQISIRQRRLGNGFAPSERGPYSFQEIIAWPCEDLPTPPPQWKAVLENANKVWDVKPGDVLVPPKDAKWEFETNAGGHVIGRILELNHYQRDVETRPNPCGTGTRALLFCEQGGSIYATSYNAAEHHLKEAEALAGAGKANSCRVAAWASYAFAKGGINTRFHAQRKGEWIPKASYLTREGKEMTEDGMQKAFEDIGKKAAGIFTSCKGAGEPPLRDTDLYMTEELVLRGR
jgi:hypothetical protein